MPKRFYINQYASVASNAHFVIEIWDNDYTGDPIEILNGGFTLEYEGTEADDIDMPILASRANITVNVTSVDTNFEAFLLELVESDEERFWIYIERDTEPFWAGQIPTDLVEFPDLSYAYDVNITAVCGLSRLKNIPYDNDGAVYTGRATIISHVLNMISKLNLPLTYINKANSVLEVMLPWHEVDTAYSEGSPLEFTDLAYDVFQEYDEYKVIKSENCYDALEQICRAFRLRIFQFGAKMWMQHITELTSQFFYGYLEDGNFTEASVVSSALTVTSAKRNNGLFRRLPAVRTINSEYQFKQGINNGNLLPPNVEDATNYDLGNIAGGSGEKILITGTFTLIIQENTPDERMMFVKIALKVKVGSHYLTGSVNDDTLSWSTTSTDVAYFRIGPFKQIDLIKKIPINIVTPDIPGEGTGTFMISIFRIEDDEGNLMLPATDTGLFLFAYNNSLNLKLNYEDGLPSNGLQRLISTNTTDGSIAVKSRYIIDLPETIIGDGPRLYSAGALKIFNGITWVNSQSWESVTGGAYPLHELRLRHIAANGKITRELIEFELLDGAYVPHQLLLHDSANWLPLALSFDADADSWGLMIMRLNADATNIAISDLEEAGSESGTSSSSDYNSVNSHTRLHSVTSALDHGAVAEADYGKIVGSNETTGAIEMVEKPTGYWQRTEESDSLFSLSPATIGDSVVINSASETRPALLIDNDNNAPLVVYSEGYIGVTSITVNDTAISGQSEYAQGITGNSEYGTGGRFQSAYNIGSSHYANEEPASKHKNTPESDTGISPVMLIERSCQTAGDDGIGGAINYNLRPKSASSLLAGNFSFVLTDATDATATANFIWSLLNAGSQNEAMRLTGAGVLNVKTGFSVDGTAAVTDGTYTVGIGPTTNGTITVKGGIITAITEAT